MHITAQKTITAHTFSTQTPKLKCPSFAPFMGFIRRGLPLNLNSIMDMGKPLSIPTRVVVLVWKIYTHIQAHGIGILARVGMSWLICSSLWLWHWSANCCWLIDFSVQHHHTHFSVIVALECKIVVDCFSVQQHHTHCCCHEHVDCNNPMLVQQ